MNEIPELGQDALNFIAGRWEPSAAGHWTTRYDPADNSVLVARAPDSSREDASRAIEAASQAAPEWRELPPPRRGRLLFEWFSWMDRNRDRLAELLTRE